MTAGQVVYVRSAYDSYSNTYTTVYGHLTIVQDYTNDYWGTGSNVWRVGDTDFANTLMGAHLFLAKIQRKMICIQYT